jgi:hypothetical protein
LFSLSRAVLHFIAFDFISSPRVFFLVAQLDLVLGTATAVSGRSAAANWSSVAVVNRLTPLPPPLSGPPPLSNRRCLVVCRRSAAAGASGSVATVYRLSKRPCHRVLSLPELSQLPSPVSTIATAAYRSATRSSRGVTTRSVLDGSSRLDPFGRLGSTRLALTARLSVLFCQLC